MKKFTLFAFLFLFGCMTYALAQTDEQQPPEDQQMPEQQQMPAQEQQQTPTTQNQQITGVIQKIDLQKKTISIKDEASRTTQDVDFNETTTLFKAGQSLTVGELQKGDKVSLEVDAQNIATKIEVVAPEPVPPPEEQKQ